MVAWMQDWSSRQWKCAWNFHSWLCKLRTDTPSLQLQSTPHPYLQCLLWFNIVTSVMTPTDIHFFSHGLLHYDSFFSFFSHFTPLWLLLLHSDSVFFPWPHHVLYYIYSVRYSPVLPKLGLTQIYLSSSQSLWTFVLEVTLCKTSLCHKSSEPL